MLIQERKRRPKKSRAKLLAEIAGLPSSAFVNTEQAAAYIGSSPGVMANWRSQRRGPRYHGSDDFVRYRISNLDLWMSSRADEVLGYSEQPFLGEGIRRDTDERTVERADSAEQHIWRTSDTQINGGSQYPRSRREGSAVEPEHSERRGAR